MSERGTGRAKLVMPPRGKGRRTQAERNQLSTEEKARTQDIQIQSQQQQQDAAEKIEREKRARRGFLLERSRGRAGRGSFSGRGTSVIGAEPLGPLAAGSVIASDRTKTFERPWAPSKRGRTGSATSWSMRKVKKEYSDGIEHSVTPSASRKGRSLRRVVTDDDEDAENKGEDDESISDINFEEGPRKNVDQIDLISDDEDMGEEIAERRTSFLPFRVHRVEHRDRISQVTSKAEDLELKTKVEEDDVVETGSSRRKAKSRVRDLESPRTIRHWSGVFPEEELDAFMGGPLSSTTDSRRYNQLPPEPRRRSRETRVKKRHVRDLPAGWQTQEEEDEWKRTLEMMDDIVEVLGKQPDPRDPDAIAIDEETSGPEERNQVYLFQFPAVMPPLVLSSDLDKMEPEEKQQNVSKWMDTLNGKLDEGQPTPVANNRPPHLPKAGGKVGKLRVYKSGRTEIDWGGLPFKLKMGIEPAFVQEAVLVRPNGDGGDAYSFGEIERKFIVIPDLAQFFPKAESEEE